MNHVLLMLERSARRYPDKIAVIEEEKVAPYYSCKGIQRLSQSYLIQNSIQQEPVIVFMDKGIMALYAFFGSAYAQNFYSLLNPEFPESRLEQIQSVLQARIDTCIAL